MLSVPDFKEKQIILIQIDPKDQTRLKLTNNNLVYEKDSKLVNQVSLDKILAIFVIGHTTITTYILENLAKKGIGIIFLKSTFRQYSSILPVSDGNFLVRNRQYNLTKDFELDLAKKIITQKISNQIKLLYRKDNSEVLAKINKLKKSVGDCVDNYALLGVEGSVSKLFFNSHFEGQNWIRRTPRTKQDITNLLLDIGYTYLFNFIDCILKLYGFDTYKGFYHQLFFQRKSLTCDIMEPFRCIIDKALLKAYNLGQIDERDFKLINYRYVIEFAVSKKYSIIFLNEILDQKVEIFKYIQQFYRYFMRPDKYDFPNFIIK